MGLIWISEFILACQQMTVAGAVVTYYFTRYGQLSSAVSSLEMELAEIMRDTAFAKNACFHPESWRAVELTCFKSCQVLK